MFSVVKSLFKDCTAFTSQNTKFGILLYCCVSEFCRAELAYLHMDRPPESSLLTNAVQVLKYLRNSGAKNKTKQNSSEMGMRRERERDR